MILGDVTEATLGAFGGVWRDPPIRLLYVFYRLFRSKSWFLGGRDLNSLGEGFGDRFGVDFGDHFSGRFWERSGMVWEGPNDENVLFSFGFHRYFIDFDGSWGGVGSNKCC